jgi:hypothetical protein
MPQTIKSDTALTKEQEIADSLISQVYATEGLYYEFGMAGYAGWKGDAQGISPLVGINYMNRTGNRTALSFGIQYVSVPNLHASSKTSRIATYGYGEKSSVTVIQPSTLQYLVVPLRFNYFSSARNSFGAGLNLCYLLTVVADVTTFDEGPGYKSTPAYYKQSGYTTGFTWFDAQASVFYRRRFARSFAAQADVFYGLIDVKQNGFFGTSLVERNTGLKLSLIYFGLTKTTK